VLATGFYAPRGNLNASEEIDSRKKKCSTFGPKMVHIGILLAQPKILFVLLRNSISPTTERLAARAVL
jgi:hypothetical protein